MGLKDRINRAKVVYDWKVTTSPDIDYDYSRLDYRGWHLEVCHEPDNMGNFGWRAWNSSGLGITEVHGISFNVLGAKENVMEAVNLIMDNA